TRPWSAPKLEQIEKRSLVPLGACFTQYGFKRTLHTRHTNAPPHGCAFRLPLSFAFLARNFPVDDALRHAVEMRLPSCLSGRYDLLSLCRHAVLILCKISLIWRLLSNGSLGVTGIASS